MKPVMIPSKGEYEYEGDRLTLGDLRSGLHHFIGHFIEVPKNVVLNPNVWLEFTQEWGHNVGLRYGNEIISVNVIKSNRTPIKRFDFID